MAELSADAERLAKLCRVMGRNGVADRLGVDLVALDLMAAGEAPIETYVAMAIDQLQRSLGEVSPGWDDDEELAAEIVLQGGPEEGVDIDGDGVPDVVPGDVGPVTKVVGYDQERDQRRASLRRAREVACMTQFRIGLSPQDQVAAMALVTRIELALIGFFRDSVPDPGVEWDGERRSREIERRLARLRWIDREQEREFTGLRGIWNWMAGRKQVTGKELYRRMLDEVDEMMGVGAVAEAREGGLAKLMELTGVEYIGGGAGVKGD